MAKQNVGFAERHLEKIVIGVAGAILGAAIFLYVVQDPYKVDVNGQAYGPNDFYKQLDAKAKESLDSLRNASKPTVANDWKRPQDVRKPALDLPVFASLNPPVPKPERGLEVGGKLDLTEILPPGRPATTAGRALAALPPPQHKFFTGETSQPPEQVQEREVPKDTFWVSAFASVPRRTQQDLFMNAKYAVDRQQLMVTKVEAERQRLLPNGEWEEPVPVTVPKGTEPGLFLKMDIICPATVEITTTPNGQSTIAEENYKLIEQLVGTVKTDQAAILRPDFQTHVDSNQRTDWKVPAEMPDGTRFDWIEDYRVTTEKGTPGAVEARLPGRPGETPGTTAKQLTPANAIKEIKALAEKGQKAEASRKLDEAQDLYNQVETKITTLLANPAVTAKDKTEMMDLQTQLTKRLTVLKTQATTARDQRRVAQEATLGADVDLCWITDTSVKPGETYRYRIRLLAVNPHAGLLLKLKNPQDAAKVILAGRWSEWSTPSTVPSGRHLFVTGPDQATQGVKVELFQWAEGDWKVGKSSLSVGQPVRWEDKLQTYDYDAVIVALDPARAYEEVVKNTKGKKTLSSRQGMVITMVSSNGDVEEHAVTTDVARRKELLESPEFKRGKETPGKTPAVPTPRELERERPTSPRTPTPRRAR